MPAPRLHPRVQGVIDAYRGTGREEVPSDVTGSYTGLGLKGDRPVQDADDL